MKKLADTLKARETTYRLKVDPVVSDQLDKRYSCVMEQTSILVCEVFKEYVMAQIKSGAVISDIKLTLGSVDECNDFTEYTSHIKSAHMYDTQSHVFVELFKFFNDNGLNLIVKNNEMYIEYV